MRLKGKLKLALILVEEGAERRGGFSSKAGANIFRALATGTVKVCLVCMGPNLWRRVFRGLKKREGIIVLY